MPTHSLNDIAAKIVKDEGLLGECLCCEFAHLIVEQGGDNRPHKLKID